jgi:hypothetical protein
MEALLDGDEELTRKAIELAKTGDLTALRLCWDRILRPRKDRHIALSLPAMNEPADAAKGLSAIVATVASRELTPSEAAELTKLVESFARVLGARDGRPRGTPAGTGREDRQWQTIAGGLIASRSVTRQGASSFGMIARRDA